MSDVVACGAVVWRRGLNDALEVLVVHRPRYDDWSFAKGKIDRGETIEDCARREVFEETGFAITLGTRLPRRGLRGSARPGQGRALLGGDADRAGGLRPQRRGR